MSPTWRNLADETLRMMQALVIPQAPATPSSRAVLRQADLYVGQFSADAALATEGLAGRSPAAFVDFHAEEVVAPSVGRTIDRTEATIVVYLGTDTHRTRRDRAALWDVGCAIRDELVFHEPQIECERYRYIGTLPVMDAPQAYVVALRFRTRYALDYARDPGVALNGVGGEVRHDGVPVVEINKRRP